jgi:Tfp pilus assembly protein PilW
MTIAEVIVGLVVGVIVLGGIYNVMMVQGRAFGKQRELMDVRETSRGAVSLLAWELRQAASGGSAIAATTADSISLRAVQGLGIVCAKHATLPRYALWRTSGTIAATTDDSVLVGKIGQGTWRVMKVNQVSTPAALGVATCSWAGARAPDLAVEVTVTTAADTLGVAVGSPIRTFRRTVYAEFQTGGRWWLGRRVGAAATFDQLTGPLLPPASGGLSFAYYDTLGVVTATPALVATVRATIRTESYKQSRVGTGPLQYQRDTLVTKVALRR